MTNRPSARTNPAAVSAISRGQVTNPLSGTGPAIVSEASPDSAADRNLTANPDSAANPDSVGNPDSAANRISGKMQNSAVNPTRASTV